MITIARGSFHFNPSISTSHFAYIRNRALLLNSYLHRESLQMKIFMKKKSLRRVFKISTVK